jgi:hypothetical protein
MSEPEKLTQEQAERKALELAAEVFRLNLEWLDR